MPAGSVLVNNIAQVHRAVLWDHLPQFYGNVSNASVFIRLVAELEWVMSILHSRTFSATATGRWAAIIPLIDFANHESGALHFFRRRSSLLQPVDLLPVVNSHKITPETCRYEIVAREDVQCGVDVTIEYRGELVGAMLSVSSMLS
jgi:hypothetical protein